MKVKYVIFDFDGTLINSNDAVISMLHLASEKHRGVPFTQEELDEVIGKPIDTQMAFLSLEKKDELVAFYRSEYRKVRDELTKAYDGMREVLIELKQLGIQTAIVSNKGRSGIDHGMEMFDLEQLIDVTVSKDDVIHPKPDLEGIFKALELLGKDESESEYAVFVGDSAHDIMCGKAARCKTILVGWTLINREKLMIYEPDAIVETPGDILTLLKQW